jgi:ribosomal-protein-serine acetyltransferase
VSTVTAALFTWPLGDDVVLIPRTPAIADAHFSLVEANYQRLARWFPDAFQEPPTLDGVRANLQRAGEGWLDADFVGRGLATRTVAAMLDHAFGPHERRDCVVHGLNRVGGRRVRQIGSVGDRAS